MQRPDALIPWPFMDLSVISVVLTENCERRAIKTADRVVAVGGMDDPVLVRSSSINGQFEQIGTF